MTVSLLVLGLLVAAQSPFDWTKAQTVTVTLSNFSFAPRQPQLQAGHAYQLHLVNAASGSHNFAARDFFGSARVVAADQYKVQDGTVELHGGETVDVRLIAPPAGAYDLKCTHFMHSTFGMRGKILVR